MEQANLSRIRLAVVDGDPAVRHALSFALETRGLVVATFSDGESVLAARGWNDWICLVVDQRLPGISGLDLLVRLRGEGFSAPTILVATNPSPGLRARADAASVSLVEKPLLDDRLPRLVCRIAQLSGLGSAHPES